ncbi:MAG: hypothetical protein IJU19_04240 [Bacteroidales bacterium]|nr:hypothetical protein [Bacteroidales bacterium]
MKNLSSLTKRIVFASVLMVIAGVVVISCNKESYSIEERALEASAKLGYGNPFAYIGQQHNSSLTAIGWQMKDMMDSVADLSYVTYDDYAAVYDSMLNVTRRRLYTAANCSASKVDSIVDNIQNMVENESGDLFYIPENIQATWDTIELRMPNNADVYALIDTMGAWITRICQNLSTSEDTMRAITLTVHQYSLYYWNNAISSSSNPWYSFLNWVDNDCEDCLGFNPEGEDGERSFLGDIFHNIGQGISNAFHAVVSNKTVRKVAYCDAQGAIGGFAWGMLTPATLGSSILISAVASSAIGPFLVK